MYFIILSRWFMLFSRKLFVLLLTVLASPAWAADPLVFLSFDDESIVNKGSAAMTGISFTDSESDAPVYVDTGIGTIKGITFDGTNYIDTTTSTGTLGISGAAAKTVSALIKVDTVGNYSLWTVGTTSNLQDFTLKVEGEKTLNAQLWGGDFGTTTPASLTSGWALVSLTYDGTDARVYYNGAQIGSAAKVLNTGVSNVKVGFWNALANSYRGSMAEFQIYGTALSSSELLAQARNYGGNTLTFSEVGTLGVSGDSEWHSGCGNTMFRVDPSTYPGMLTSYPYPLDGLNQNTDGSYDGAMGMIWGQTFTVLDDSKSISLTLSGGAYAAAATETGGTNLTALRNKGGFILYDVTQSKFLLDTWRCADTNGTAVAKTISLNGLQDHTLAMVFFDLTNNSWGMTAVDNISIPLGTAKFNEIGPMVLTTKTWNFDDSSDWEGWHEVDLNGNTLDSITHFQFGSPSACLYSIGNNFITSTTGTSWDSPTGILRSEEFTIDGNIIEFMINGGKNIDAGLELWVQKPNEEGADSDFELVYSTLSEQFDGTNSFEYSFWDVSDFDGLTAYIQLRDSTSGSWGWLGVDNIQMISLNPTPEPAAWCMLLAGMVFLGGSARFRRQGWRMND